MDQDTFEERTKAVVASLLAKIDAKDAEIARVTTALENFKHIMLEHQEEGEALYRKIQDQEKTILGLLTKVKLGQTFQPSSPTLTDQSTDIFTQEIAQLKEELQQKDNHINSLTKVLNTTQPPTPVSVSSIPPPPVLFVRPPRYRHSLADVKSSSSENLLESLVDELLGESDEMEMLYKKVAEQHHHLVTLETALDVAEVELTHWRETTRHLVQPDVGTEEEEGHD